MSERLLKALYDFADTQALYMGSEQGSDDERLAAIDRDIAASVLIFTFEAEYPERPKAESPNA